MKHRLVYCLLSLLIGSAASSQAQEGLPRYSPGTIYVRFPDDAGYRVSEGALLAPGGGSPQLDSLRKLGYWRRSSLLSDDQLRAMRRNAQRSLGRPLPDPAAAFRFQLYDGAAMVRALEQLRRLERVRQVLQVPVPRNAQAPDYSGRQTYRVSSTSGINADSVYLVYNNRGAGIQICDIEYDFHRTHADLPAVTVIGPAPIPIYGNDHATAVLGEIASKADGVGTTGIASDSRLYFAGAYTLSGQDSIYDLEGPILNAAATLKAGDVILLEQQIAGPDFDTANPASQKGYVPVEWFKPYYDAIVLATGNGVIVVEAAGNGQQNLDAPAYNTGNDGHHPFAAGNSSGAIIVGAGSVGPVFGGTGAARSRLWFSNYGSRLDLQGNGEQVTTTGYGDLYIFEGEDKYYTSQFGGTSSASPIVTGAVALLQSVYKANHGGGPLSPGQVRDLLVSTGREQAAGVYGDKNTARIGPLPDVFAAINKVMKLGVPAPAAGLQASLAPNPAARVATLRLEGARSAELELRVVNTLGTCLRRERLPAQTAGYDLDVSGLPAGIYQVLLSDGADRATLRLTVLQ